MALLLELHAMENPRTKYIEVFWRWVNMRDLYSPRKTDVTYWGYVESDG